MCSNFQKKITEPLRLSVRACVRTCVRVCNNDDITK